VYRPSKVFIIFAFKNIIYENIFFNEFIYAVVYNLAEMRLETMARVETENELTRQYNKNTFSISKQKLQICFTRGLQTVE
jgi:hypothetical protein